MEIEVGDLVRYNEAERERLGPCFWCEENPCLGTCEFWVVEVDDRRALRLQNRLNPMYHVRKLVDSVERVSSEEAAMTTGDPSEVLKRMKVKSEERRIASEHIHLKEKVVKTAREWMHISSSTAHEGIQMEVLRDLDKAVRRLEAFEAEQEKR